MQERVKGSRRAGGVAGFVAVAGVLALLVGCGEREAWRTDDPREAVQIFMTALYAQRAELAWPMLTPGAQDELKARAEALNREAGGEVVQPAELLLSTGVLGPHHIARVEKRSEAGDRATVLVRTHDEREFPVELQRVDEVWRIELGALPAAKDLNIQPDIKTPAAPEPAASAPVEGSAPAGPASAPSEQGAVPEGSVEP